jgi:hypothetical protein
LVLQQFSDVLPVNEFLLRLFWTHQGDAGALKLLGVEARVHRKSGAK